MKEANVLPGTWVSYLEYEGKNGECKVHEGANDNKIVEPWIDI